MCHLLRCTGVAKVESGVVERRYALPGQPRGWYTCPMVRKK